VARTEPLNGADYLEFETFFSNGTDRTAKIAITVK